MGVGNARARNGARGARQAPSSGRSRSRSQWAGRTTPKCRRSRVATLVSLRDSRIAIAAFALARDADRRPVAVKMQSRASAKRRDDAAGLERRPPVGTALRDRAAHGTAPSCVMVLSRGATGRKGRARVFVAQGK